MNDLVKKQIIREGLLEIEQELAEYPQVEMPPTHLQAKDLYAREIDIPAGTLLIGKIHKHSSLNIMLKGEMTLLTEDGVKRIKAPFRVVSKPGIKRMGYAHTDCTWLSVHGTQEVELDKIEQDVIAQTFDDVEFLEEDKKKFLETIDREDLCLG